LTKKDVDLSGRQQEAVDLCLDRQVRICSVTGRAGTGKTTVLGTAYTDTELQVGKDRVGLCAPTGRAAKRIFELTGIKAKTVHKLLEFPEPDEEDKDGNPLPTEPRRNRERPLFERVLYMDEASMLSQGMYEYVMAALPNNGRIRFFGDDEQLPPVEAGTPFQDILKTKPKVVLEHCFRSDDEVIMNAERIRMGRVPQRNHRFEIVYTNNPIKTLIDLVDERFCEQNHQIIMPTRVGKYGTARVNPSLQLKFNPTGDILRVDRMERLAQRNQDPPIALRGGDKFLWTKNDYTLKLYNGETGHIDWVNSEDGSLQLSMDDRTIVVPPFIQVYSPYHGSIIHYDPRKKVQLGYAVTTHKSQGSEYDTIVYCMSRGAPRLLNRRNFYTAVTRAKHRVIVICDAKAMGLSLRRHNI
jgi:exodeoxyribonuclease V alpha subunit